MGPVIDVGTNGEKQRHIGFDSGRRRYPGSGAESLPTSTAVRSISGLVCYVLVSDSLSIQATKQGGKN